MASGRGPNHERWLKQLLKLRPAVGRRHQQGVAPHKPLLLLCLIDLADTSPLLRTHERSASLNLRFRAYGNLVSERWPNRLDLRLPFYHLKNQGFWTAWDEQMRPATAPENCFRIELDPEFHAALSDPIYRLDARLILTRTYFTAPERIALLEAMGLRNKDIVEEHAEALVDSVKESARRRGRSARFQIGVVDGYRHTCALTGYRCFTVDGATVVDAAHIEGWAESQNDDLVNGLALSKTAHWMFDEGLWTVSDDLRVIVADSRFTESAANGFSLSALANQPLRFAKDAPLRPSRICLRQHRRAHGFEA